MPGHHTSLFSCYSGVWYPGIRSHLVWVLLSVTRVWFSCSWFSTHLVNISIMMGSFLLCLFFSFVISALGDVTTMTDKILKDILKDYNPKARPAGNLSDRWMVYLILTTFVKSYSFQRSGSWHKHCSSSSQCWSWGEHIFGWTVLSLIFQLGTLSSHVWFVMRWRDTRLKWVTNYDFGVQ